MRGTYAERCLKDKFTLHKSLALRQKSSLPSDLPDPSLKHFLRLDYDTSIELEFPGNTESRRPTYTILLSFPPPESLARILFLREKQLKEPFATVTFPKTVSYDAVVDSLTKRDTTLTAISGVSVKRDSYAPATTWDLKVLMTEKEVDEAVSRIREALLAGGDPETTDREHVVPFQWTEDGKTPIHALLMSKATKAEEVE